MKTAYENIMFAMRDLSNVYCELEKLKNSNSWWELTDRDCDFVKEALVEISNAYQNLQIAFSSYGLGK